MFITKLFTESYFINTPTALYSSFGNPTASQGRPGQLGELASVICSTLKYFCVPALALEAETAKMNKMLTLPFRTLLTVWLKEIILRLQYVQYNF